MDSFRWISNGGYTYVNRAAARFMRKSPEELLGKLAVEMFPEAVRLRFYSEFNRAIQENTAVHFEAFYPEPLHIWCECHFYPSAEGLTVYFRDVTARKQIEEALQHSEEKYKSLVEACPDAVVMSDLHGQVLFASPQAWKLLGLADSDALAGHSVFDYVIEEDRKRLAENMSRLMEAGTRRDTEYTALRRDGATLPTETSSTIIWDAAHQPKALIAVIRDISGRKRAEEALRQQHDQLQTIYDGMIEGLVITDIETERFVRVNGPLCRMLGYAEQELLTLSIQDIHPPEEVPNDLQRFQTAAAGRVSLNEDRPILRKDGSVFYADISGHRILYEGRPCLLALFRDVTEHGKPRPHCNANGERCSTCCGPATTTPTDRLRHPRRHGANSWPAPSSSFRSTIT